VHKCTHPDGCGKQAKSSGLCVSHLQTTPICKHGDGCRRWAEKDGYCLRHGSTGSTRGTKPSAAGRPVNHDMVEGEDDVDKPPSPSKDKSRRPAATEAEPHNCKHPEGCNKLAMIRGDFCIAHGRIGKKCKHPDGCDERAESCGFCVVHGGKVKCKHPSGCERNATLTGGLCVAHGGAYPKPRCKHPDGCEKYSSFGGLCVAHGGGYKCKHPDGCDKIVVKSGLCRRHWNALNPTVNPVVKASADSDADIGDGENDNEEDHVNFRAMPASSASSSSVVAMSDKQPKAKASAVSAKSAGAAASPRSSNSQPQEKKTRTKSRCKHPEGCLKRPLKGGFCLSHGGVPYVYTCKYPEGCDKKVARAGLCLKHLKAKAQAEGKVSSDNNEEEEEDEDDDEDYDDDDEDSDDDEDTTDDDGDSDADDSSPMADKSLIASKKDKDKHKMPEVPVTAGVKRPASVLQSVQSIQPEKKAKSTLGKAGAKHQEGFAVVVGGVCRCSSCEHENYRRENGLTGELALNRGCVFSKRLFRDLEAFSACTSGSEGSIFLQRLANCQETSSRERSIAYSYINQDFCPTAAHIFGTIVKTNSGKMTFDILCMHVPEDLRGRGIGKKLFAMLEDDVKARARRLANDDFTMRVEAPTSELMEESREFWRKMGFKKATNTSTSTQRMEKSISI